VASGVFFVDRDACIRENSFLSHSLFDEDIVPTEVLIMLTSFLVLVALLRLETSFAFAVKPKLARFREGGSLPPPSREPMETSAGRDVIVKVYDISTPELCSALSLITGKQVLWFPKLTVGCGGRTWSYDGEVERTVDAIVENAAGGPPLRAFNLGYAIRILAYDPFVRSALSVPLMLNA
jgi:hypothetical protein